MSDKSGGTLSNNTVDLQSVLGLSESLLVSGVALNSRELKHGHAFVALQGAQIHGLAFAAEAKRLGAKVLLLDRADAALIGDKRYDCELPIVLVGSLRLKLGDIARAVYGAVDQQLRLIGVTGTDGKTSITHFIAQLLTMAGSKCAVLGTVGNGFLESLSDSSHTTGDVFQVYRQLAMFAEQGASAVAMEVSSHALDQDRVQGLEFAVAVLSNLGSDHLDYHGSLDQYANSKARLFDRRAKACVLNLDDDFGRTLQAVRQDSIGYSRCGESGANWLASENRLTHTGLQCVVAIRDYQQEIKLPLIGAFNISNVLAAFATVELLGVSVDVIFSNASQLKPVVGRAELLVSSKGSKVVIDYAHTAQALESILCSVKQHFESDVWCVFGCGGDRDNDKRAQMGRVASAIADHIVVTSDNPRSEDPRGIVDQIMQGIDSSARTHIEIDRARAITFALENSSADDCVLIAGKGHENYQVLADQTIAFSDRENVLAWQMEVV